MISDTLKDLKPRSVLGFITLLNLKKDKTPVLEGPTSVGDYDTNIMSLMGVTRCE